MFVVGCSYTLLPLKFLACDINKLYTFSKVGTKSVLNVVSKGFLISLADYINSDSWVQSDWINSIVSGEY